MCTVTERQFQIPSVRQPHADEPAAAVDGAEVGVVGFVDQGGVQDSSKSDRISQLRIGDLRELHVYAILQLW